MKILKRLLLINSLALLSVPSFAESFYVSPAYFESKDYYSKCQDKCPSIEYQFINTGHDWLDNQINKDIIGNMALLSYDKDSAENKRWQAFFANKNPTKAGLINQLNVAIDSVVQENAEFLREQEGTALRFSVSSQPTYLGHKSLKNGTTLELFSVFTDQYTGGAHGMAWEHYYAFDMKNKKLLSIDDIILPNKQHLLKQKLHAEYQNYLRKHEIDPKEFETWEFFVTDNFQFDQNGITFLYQPYEITPYVMGIPEIRLNYKDLSGIIKAEYLD